MGTINTIKLTTGFEGQTGTFNAPGETGFWYMGGAASGPTDNWGLLMQIRSPRSMHPTTSDAYYAQLFFGHLGGVYSRFWNGTSWTNWKTL